MSARAAAGERLAVSVGEAATMVGVSRATLYPLIGRGELASFTLGPRRLVPVAALREWVERQAEPPAELRVVPTAHTRTRRRVSSAAANLSSAAAQEAPGGTSTQIRVQL